MHFQFWIEKFLIKTWCKALRFYFGLKKCIGLDCWNIGNFGPQNVGVFCMRKQDVATQFYPIIRLSIFVSTRWIERFIFWISEKVNMRRVQIFFSYRTILNSTFQINFNPKGHLVVIIISVAAKEKGTLCSKRTLILKNTVPVRLCSGNVELGKDWELKFIFSRKSFLRLSD